MRNTDEFGEVDYDDDFEKRKGGCGGQGLRTYVHHDDLYTVECLAVDSTGSQTALTYS